MDEKQLESEFITLVENYKRVIYKVCFIYATDRENLNDLYQETVVNLWKGYRNFRNESKPSGWIYKIALNTCISFYRKSNSRPEVIPLSVEHDFVYENESSKDRSDALYVMIDRLGKLEKALILLWLEEKSYQEIADITGLTKANVAVKLNRIKEKLKTMSNW